MKRQVYHPIAALVDHVFPDVPVRQWVISFPWRLRYLLALDADLCRVVRRMFLRAVFGFYSRKARDNSIAHGRTGGVNQIQRYGSALNANTHFHALVLDGVYTAPDALADVLRCKHCRSRRRLVSLITERSVILRILAHLGLDTDPPPIQPARAPPQLELGF